MKQLKRGKVERFDEQSGLGELRSESGRIYPFHCTQIDGSRSILPGTEVFFEVGPGHLGDWEARWVTPA